MKNQSDEALLSSLADRLYSLFVINTEPIGYQMADGSYRRRVVPVSPALIEAMLKANGSMETRKAWELWLDNMGSKAAKVVTKAAESMTKYDSAYAGTLFQMASAMQHDCHELQLSEHSQKRAHGLNKNLYDAITAVWGIPVTLQAAAVVSRLLEGKARHRDFEAVASELQDLDSGVGHKRYEASLERLGYWLGFEAKRFDNHGDGPDVFWLLDASRGIAFEAKSEKEPGNALNKTEHGQLLVAKEWAKAQDPGVEVTVVSAHPSPYAQPNAYAQESHVITLDSLREVRDSVVDLLHDLYDQAEYRERLERRAAMLLNQSHLTPDAILGERIELFRWRDSSVTP